MHGRTFAIALCLALGPALADEAPAPRKPAGEGLMHAALVVPAPSAQAGGITPQGPLMQGKPQQPAPLHEGKQQQPAREERPVLAMLLAALAVMIGIVVRRWSGGQP